MITIIGPGQRIVRQWSDSSCLTGETRYETESGQVYKTHFGSTRNPLTGQSFAEIRDGMMVPVSSSYDSPKAPIERLLNRHDRRAATSPRHWKNQRRPR